MLDALCRRKGAKGGVNSCRDIPADAAFEAAEEVETDRAMMSRVCNGTGREPYIGAGERD